MCVTSAFYSVFSTGNMLDTAKPAQLFLLLTRLFALLAFILISLQLTLGALHSRLIQILGAKAYQYHIVFGLTGLFVLFLHPLSYGLSNYFLTNSFSDLVVLLPKIPTGLLEVYISIGRVAFYLLITSITVAYLRKRFFRRSWHKIHYLNYIAYPMILVHSKYLGINVNSTFGVFYLSLAIVGMSAIFYRFYKFAISHIRKATNQKVKV